MNVGVELGGAGTNEAMIGRTASPPVPLRTRKGTSARRNPGKCSLGRQLPEIPRRRR